MPHQQLSRYDLTDTMNYHQDEGNVYHSVGSPEYRPFAIRLQRAACLSTNTLRVTYFEWFAKRGNQDIQHHEKR